MGWPLELWDELNTWDGRADAAVVESAVDILPWALIAAFGVSLAVVTLFWRVRRVRWFWCPLVRREVEVEFEHRGPLGLRRSCVMRCSVFDPSSDVTCRRRCVNAGFRNRWEWPVRVATR
jgi:hypothetical protein